MILVGRENLGLRDWPREYGIPWITSRKCPQNFEQLCVRPGEFYIIWEKISVRNRDETPHFTFIKVCTHVRIRICAKVKGGTTPLVSTNSPSPWLEVCKAPRRITCVWCHWKWTGRRRLVTTETVTPVVTKRFCPSFFSVPYLNVPCIFWLIVYNRDLWILIYLSVKKDDETTQTLTF